MGACPGAHDLMNGVVAFFLDPANWAGSTGIPNRLQEHLVICGFAVLTAALIAIPIGLYVGHTNNGSGVAINLANIGRAVPSYAMMVIPVPLTLTLAPIIGYSANFGLVWLPPYLAMTFLAIPPLLVSTYAGLRSVDQDLLEAGRGMGLRERQILTKLELPLSSSIIVGGLRTATLQVIATATIAAILGGGGLGRFIFDGLNQGIAGEPSIFAGAILVAALAIGIDILLALVQRQLTPKALREKTASPAESFSPGMEVEPAS